jgi:hypothetical protein
VRWGTGSVAPVVVLGSVPSITKNGKKEGNSDLLKFFSIIYFLKEIEKRHRDFAKLQKMIQLNIKETSNY